MNPATDSDDPFAATEHKPPVVTPDDHEAGKKDVAIEFRSGRTDTWTIQAIPARQARNALVTLLRGGSETNPILELAVPKLRVGDIDKLTLDSLADVEHVAMTLAFGEAEQKKMVRAAAVFAKAMFASSLPPNSGLPGAVSPSPNSEAGASPSSDSTSKS